MTLEQKLKRGEGRIRAVVWNRNFRKKELTAWATALSQKSIWKAPERRVWWEVKSKT